MTGIQYARCANARNTILRSADCPPVRKIPVRATRTGMLLRQARLLSAMTLRRIGLSTNSAKATTTMFIKAVTTNTACQLP